MTVGLALSHSTTDLPIRVQFPSLTTNSGFRESDPFWEPPNRGDSGDCTEPTQLPHRGSIHNT